MKPWNLLRACFYLFGIVVLIMMLETLISVSVCSFVIVVQQRDQTAVCTNFAGQIREIMAELIAGILALIVASRPDNHV